jgi:hypothetical protein
MNLRISVLADRPDLIEPMHTAESPWPEFMRHDPIGNTFYASSDLFADYILVGQDEAGDVVAQAFSAPFVNIGGELFDDGWDGVLRRAIRTRLMGDKPDTISAVEISIKPGLQGTGLSAKMLAAMRANAARLGFTELLAPVRPNGKQDPDVPMSEYAYRVREDGLPVDPWLRVHVRAGGRIEKVAPRSMVIPGTLTEWREWTGLPFDKPGPVHVPKALTPVMCDPEHDYAVYVEPNVWVRHVISG